ncbi:hypothetical protein Q8W33_09145 [Shimia thalassica]|nr:hypothetical protein [Shimia thalassica]
MSYEKGAANKGDAEGLTTQKITHSEFLFTNLDNRNFLSAAQYDRRGANTATIVGRIETDGINNRVCRSKL